MLNVKSIAAIAATAALSLALFGCAQTSSVSSASSQDAGSDTTASSEMLSVNDTPQPSAAKSKSTSDAGVPKSAADDASRLRADLAIEEDYRDSFVHGDKGSKFQKYIVLHDTEGDGDASGVINYWDGSGAGVASHFVVNKDGTVWQCVPLDKIAHHAGFGDTGHNELYGVEDESRDDKVGTVPIGDWAADYGMNSYSIGIEMVHVGGSGDYPTEQLEALDKLIAYIDAYYGLESEIIDHKAWRSGNSDTSEEFAGYLANYQDHRSYK